MFSQTPERQASAQRDAARRDANPRRSAAKGYVEFGKAVIEHRPSAPVVIPPTAESVEAPVTPGEATGPAGTDSDSEESLTDNLDETT